MHLTQYQRDNLGYIHKTIVGKYPEFKGFNIEYNRITVIGGIDEATIKAEIDLINLDEVPQKLSYDELVIKINKLEEDLKIVTDSLKEAVR